MPIREILTRTNKTKHCIGSCNGFTYFDQENNYYKKNADYLKTQLGNPEGDGKPNKKYYDPRKWLLEGEKKLIERLRQSFIDLNNINRNE